MGYQPLMPGDRSSWDPSWEWSGDHWLHRPWWKVAINTVLRWFQPWPRKWVVYTRVREQGRPDHPSMRPPLVLGYGFGRVFHRSS